MGLDEGRQSRLAELRALDAEREAKAQEAAEERELEARELAFSLEQKGLKEGHDFKVLVSAIGGVFAIRKPDGKAIRNWELASEKQKLSLEWQIGLLRNYIVEPDEKSPTKGIQWAQLSAQRPGLCWKASTAFVELMGVDVEERQKK